MTDVLDLSGRVRTLEQRLRRLEKTVSGQAEEITRFRERLEGRNLDEVLDQLVDEIARDLALNNPL